MSHMCSTKDMAKLFVGKPDELVLAFDAILEGTAQWEPNTAGASINTIVFTSRKAWLIVRPMTKELDVKFYNDEKLESDALKKVSAFGKRYAYHIRLKSAEEVDGEVFRLLKMGHEYSLR